MLGIGEESTDKDALRECGTWWNNRRTVRAGHSNTWLTVRGESTLQCNVHMIGEIGWREGEQVWYECDRCRDV